MLLSFPNSGIAVGIALLAQRASANCESYGVDIQDGGSYFQNNESAVPFTFVSQFEGCESDWAYNLLIDPNGTEYQCTNTTLQPDNTNELSTCPLGKNQLYSGPWIILVLSNNNAIPMAFQRNFHLTVAAQQTSTYTPTVTLTTTTTPIVRYVTTSTYTHFTTLSPQTVTEVGLGMDITLPTIVDIPFPVVREVTKTVLTVTAHSPSVQVVQAIQTKTAFCAMNPRQPTRDSQARFAPALPAAQAIMSAVSKWKNLANHDLPQYKTAHHQKRAPDARTVTMLESDTARYRTTTSTTTAPASTLTGSSLTQTTLTITPGPVTVKHYDVHVDIDLHIFTITLPTPTIWLTQYDIATAQATGIVTQTVNLTTTVTPAAAKESCVRAGGVMAV